jgi:O-antigen/teichoic acid export membrane protein
MHRATYHLLTNAVFSSALGFLYWLVAARVFPAEVVGRAGALVSAMALFALIGQLNLSGALMRFLPVAGERRKKLVVGTYSVAVAVAVLSAVLTLLLISVIDPRSSLHLPLADALIFCVSVGFWVIFILEDNVLIGLRRTAWVPVENATFGVSKIVLIGVFATAFHKSTVSLFLTSVLPLLLICPVINLLIFKVAIPRARATDEPSRLPDFSGFRRFVIGDAAGGLLFQGWSNLLPIVVIVTLGGAANALFYVAFLISTTLDLLPTTLTAALVVEASSSRSKARELVGSTMRRMIWMVAIAVTVGVALAPALLRLYGGHYVEGTLLLRLLLISSIPKASIVLFVGICRIEGRTHLAPVAWGAVFVSVIVLSLLLGRMYGVNGVGVAVLLSTGWVGGLCAWGTARYLKEDSSRGY